MMDNHPEYDALEVFDHADFNRRMLNDDEIIAKVISQILDRMPKMIHELRTFIEQNDIPSAGRQAHTIKGTAANLGCRLLRKSALLMEQAAESQGMDRIKELLPALEIEWTRVESVLRNIKGK